MPTCPHSPVECSGCRIARRKAERAAEAAATPYAVAVDLLERAVAAQQARAAQRDLEIRVGRAAALYSRAQEWPRCGQRWPMGAAETAAEALLAEHPEMVGHVGFCKE